VRCSDTVFFRDAKPGLLTSRSVDDQPMTSDPDTTIQKACWWKAVTANPYVLGSIKLSSRLPSSWRCLSLSYLIVPYEDFLTLLRACRLAYFIPPAGKESIIPIAIMMGYPLVAYHARDLPDRCCCRSLCGLEL